jgi:hypothetical protein
MNQLEELRERLNGMARTLEHSGDEYGVAHEIRALLSDLPQQPTGAVASHECEREAFEAWMMKSTAKGGAGCTADDLVRYPTSGKYKYQQQQLAWEALQARAALPAAGQQIPAHVEAALLWALYNHQGGNSPVGQPIRKVLGIERWAELTPEQIAKARAVAAPSPEGQQ